MTDNLRRGHDALWARFFCDETDLIYDRRMRVPDDFPTEEEIAREIPSAAGWGTGMEDCCLTAGFVLPALLRAHRVEGAEAWALKARKLFRGLVRLGTISGVPGYVARGFAPGRTDVYPNSSADQYTSYVYALWRFAQWPEATDGEKEQATALVVDVAKRVEAFDGDIPRKDGRPSIYGDTSTIEPGRACRLLMFYRAAHVMGGDAHWHSRYMESVEDEGRARIRCHYGPEEWPMPRNVHALVQSQIAFRLLFECETDKVLRAAYHDALEAEARAIAHRISMWRDIVAQPLGRAYPPRWRACFRRFIEAHADYDPTMLEQVQVWHRWRRDHADDIAPTPEEEARAEPSLPHLRHQTQALAIVMLCENDDLKREAALDGLSMLQEVDWTLVTDARVWESLNLGYWAGVESGVFPKG